MSFKPNEIRISRGYIGHDCTELLKDRNGKEYCRFSIGTSYKGNTTWYQITVYGDEAKELVKGDVCLNELCAWGMERKRGVQSKTGPREIGVAKSETRLSLVGQCYDTHTNRNIVAGNNQIGVYESKYKF